MAKNLTKRTGPTAPKQATTDAASRLKGALMADGLDRLLGKDESIAAPDNKPPRVILALANHGRTVGWDLAKTLQRGLFEAVASLEMKFAFFGRDDAAGVRRCRITTRWIKDPDDMASTIDRAACDCGCYVHLHSVLAQAVKEAEQRPLRALLIVGAAFDDDQDGLDEAAISANRLRRAGTQVFLLQRGDDAATARKLQYLARIAGGAYFRFDPRTDERQFVEMWEAVSAYAAGGEEAVKAKSGQAATLLLQQLGQVPMPIIEKRSGAKLGAMKVRP